MSPTVTMAALDEAERGRARPRPFCPNDLDAFWDLLPAGRTRHLDRLTLRERSGRMATYLVVAECSGIEAHVCAVHLGEGTPPINVVEELATEIYRRHLAPQNRGTFVWQRLLGRGAGYRPGQVRFYTYVPWHLHPFPHEQFWEHRLIWRRGAFVEQDWRAGLGQRFATVPPMLMDLDPVPSARPGGP